MYIRKDRFRRAYSSTLNLTLTGRGLDETFNGDAGCLIVFQQSEKLSVENFSH